MTRRLALANRAAKLQTDYRRMKERARAAASEGWDARPISTARLSAHLWNAIKNEKWCAAATQIAWNRSLWPATEHYNFLGGSGGSGMGYNAPGAVGAALAPAHPRNKILILFVEVRVKTLVELERKYRWQRPEQCPKCQGVRVWGHGYIEAYFDEAGSQRVCLKRYRCPECGVVIRMRPVGYWRRIQATIATVRQCVVDRLEKGRWPPGCNSARGHHWLRGLRRQVRMRLGMSYAQRIAHGFLELVRLGVCAVSRAV